MQKLNCFIKSMKLNSKRWYSRYKGHKVTRILCFKNRLNNKLLAMFDYFCLYKLPLSGKLKLMLLSSSDPALPCSLNKLLPKLQTCLTKGIYCDFERYSCVMRNNDAVGSQSVLYLL